jgi:predicted amidohydrolase YtcJ
MNHQAEVVLSNAVLWALSPMKRFPGGMRIVDGKIRQIYNRASIPQLPMMDLGGMHIIPGLIDAHRHFFVSSQMPLHGDASVWRSKHDALDAIENACRAAGAEKRWVIFSGLNNVSWKKTALPRLREIDAAAGSSPVIIIDTTVHHGLFSSSALIRAGINRQLLKFPTDIDVTIAGKLKGRLWEDALSRMIFVMYREVIQNYSAEGRRKLILDEAERCLSKGLTHVHDPGVPSDIQRLIKDAQSYTPLKISWSVTDYESLFAPPALKEDLAALHSEHAPKSVKLFLDGATRTASSIPIIAGLKATFRATKDSVRQGRSAPLRQLFEHKIILKGGQFELPFKRFKNTEELINRAGMFADKGYRLVLHALGNVAACQAAQAIQALGMGKKSSIEHATVLHLKGLDDLAGCGAVVSLQPGFIPFYAETIERMGVSPPYLKVIPLRSLMDRGVSVCISSDGPCASDDPLHNIRRAVDRKRIDGTMFDPGEAINKIEALTAGTIGGSRSLGLKNDGLVEGAPATFCVVDGDPFSDNSRVVQTWIDGKRAF